MYLSWLSFGMIKQQTVTISQTFVFLAPNGRTYYLMRSSHNLSNTSNYCVGVLQPKTTSLPASSLTSSLSRGALWKIFLWWQETVFQIERFFKVFKWKTGLTATAAHFIPAMSWYYLNALILMWFLEIVPSAAIWSRQRANMHSAHLFYTVMATADLSL